MKIKTSITLSEDIMEAVDKYSRPDKSRSEFIESAVRDFINQLERDEINQRDLLIINKHARRLNKEAQDVLHYQVDL